MNEKMVYKVSFHGVSPHAGTEHYFTSIAAIYEVFTENELGVKLQSLWAAKASKVTYSNKLVMISRVLLHSKQQKNRNKQQDNE